MASLAKKTIPEFYRNKNILITGGTGFLGTGLVEKLLRSFPQVNKIYLLVRGKNGVNSADRSNSYFNKKIFSYAKLYDPNCSSKLIWINGDLSQKNWGLSREATETIQNDVNIVFHSGANVNFQQPLKCVLENNLRATKDLLEICKGSPHLESVVYVSTAFSNARPSRLCLTEKLYPPLVEPAKLMRMLEEYSTEEFERKRVQLLQDSGDPYIFSKNVTEYVVDSYKENFAVGIFRPGIILSSIAEPFPYWIQGNVAYERILNEISKGYLFKCSHTNANCIPVDMTVNVMLAIARAVSEDRNKTKIYNYVPRSNPVSFLDSSKYYSQGIDKCTLAIRQIHYNYIFRMQEYLSRIIKYKFDNVSKREKFRKHEQIVKFFVETDIIVDNRNVLKLWEDLSEEEQRLLLFNVNNIDWKDYFIKMDKYRVVDY